MTSRRSERLIRTMVISLFFWGAPLAVLGIVPWAIVALFAMVVIGVANATYDVALFTILQRGSVNEDRAPVLSVLEVVIALGAIVRQPAGTRVRRSAGRARRAVHLGPDPAAHGGPHLLAAAPGG